MKPTASDIATAIEIIEAEEWIDPLGLAPTYWSCELFNPENRRVSDGAAWTPGVAMAMAWINYWWPDACIDCHVPTGEMPWNVPDGWSFELTPPVELAPSSVICQRRVKR
jgi:hypothetical protein